MYALNKVQILGNVTAAPEVKVTTNGSKVAQFSVATNRQWKNKDGEKQEDVEFHNVVLWAALADIAEKYVNKGNKVYVEGRLQTRSWETDDGQKRYKTEIVGENIILLTPKNSEGPGDSADVPAPKAEAKKPTKPKADDEIKIEDIPF